MKIVTYDMGKKPDWSDISFKFGNVDIKNALVSVSHINDDVLFLRSDVKITDKETIMRFFKSFKRSCAIKYGDELIGYFISKNDKTNSPSLTVRHYLLKI